MTIQEAGHSYGVGHLVKWESIQSSLEESRYPSRISVLRCISQCRGPVHRPDFALLVVPRTRPCVVVYPCCRRRIRHGTFAFGGIVPNPNTLSSGPGILSVSSSMS